MRYFLDTEFAESPGQLDLISLAIVSEDGRELYAILKNGWRKSECNDWVRENVLPNLRLVPHIQATRAELKRLILDFVDDKPEFWGYYADYDWVAFCWIFGAMVDLPNGWPIYCLDLQQRARDLGVSLPFQNDTHNALEDARDMLRNWRWLMGDPSSWSSRPRL